MRRAKALGRVLAVLTVALVAILAGMGVSGYALFTSAQVDPLEKADAIIVLSGEHDGREDYGLNLARDGWAPTVVLSNPYPKNDKVMERACRPIDGIEVICLPPYPITTRGEATLMQRLADQRSWRRIIVVSWRYHLPRARLVFRQCFSDQPGAAVMAAAPRRYDFSIARWEFVYAYQFAALAKAVMQGDCG